MLCCPVPFHIFPRALGAVLGFYFWGRFVDCLIPSNLVFLPRGGSVLLFLSSLYFFVFVFVPGWLVFCGPFLRDGRGSPSPSPGTNRVASNRSCSAAIVFIASVGILIIPISSNSSNSSNSSSTSSKQQYQTAVKMYEYPSIADARDPIQCSMIRRQVPACGMCRSFYVRIALSGKIRTI